MKHDVKTVTRVEHTVVLLEADLLEWLKRREGARSAMNKPVVTIKVPSGGDYSGMTLGVDEIGGVTVTWTEETVE